METKEYILLYVKITDKQFPMLIDVKLSLSDKWLTVPKLPKFLILQP